MRECLGLAKAFHEADNKKCDDRNVNTDKDREPPSNMGNAFQDPSKIVQTIFGGQAASKNKHNQKLTARRVLAVKRYDTIADPRYLP
jgi:hypothetical protein